MINESIQCASSLWGGWGSSTGGGLLLTKFLPSDDPNVKIWLRADLGITTDIGVSNWENQADTNILSAVSQSTDSQQPTQSTLSSGKSAINFNDDNVETMDGTLNSSLSQPNVIWTVGVVDDTNSNRALVDGGNNSNRNHVFVSTANLYTLLAGSSASTGLTVSLGSTFIMESVFNGTESSGRLNGVQGSNVDAGTQPLGVDFFVGSNFVDGALLDGKIAEIIVANSLSVDSSKIRSYLSDRYGVSA